MDFKTIVENIFQMEEELGLFSKKIGRIYFWELIRFSVVNQIAQQKGVYGQAHTKNESNTENIRKYIFNAIKNIFHKNPFFAPKSDILFFGTARRKLMEDNLWWEIYCDPVIDYLEGSYKCLLLESPYLNIHYSPSKTKNIKYLDLPLFVGWLLRTFKLFRFLPSKNEKIMLKHFQTHINKRFGVLIDLEKLVSNRVREQKSMLPPYLILLKKIRPKAVVVLVSYGKETIIKACKKLAIPVVEFQHGTISRYHSGYSFPGSSSFKKMFPDYFLTFGEYWKHSPHFPISKDKLIDAGYPFFEMEIAKYRDIPKKDQIIFISQGTIGEKMSKFAVKLKASKGLNLDIVYKLHPGEYARWKKDYPWLVDSGIRVIDDESEPLYKLLTQSKAVIGVYSTVIYESLGLGLRTFLLDLPGIENMVELIASQSVVKVSSADELKQQLAQPNQGSVRTDLFFKPNSLKNITMALGEIIEHNQIKKQLS